jgi:exosome complex RNA-binding protein Rrp4
MKKADTDVEKFAAKIADKQDNPTMHELAKSFPEKSYRELEKYRDEDRQKEAQQIPLSESQKAQEELEPIEKGVCVTGELRKARENAVKHYEDANYRQDDPDDVEVKIGHNETIWFRNECKRLVKERDEAQDALANALEVNESHQKLNGKLQTRLTELEEENKKLHDAINKRINNLRKSGL